MIRIFFRYLQKLRKHLFLLRFEQTILETRNCKKGKVKLFNKDFNYHHGPAFYNTYKEIFDIGVYEFQTNNDKPIIIDCGVNMGLSLLYFSKKYPNAEIIGFEPDETVIGVLESNIKSQNINNVILHKKAVWIEETILKFYTDNGLGGRVGIKYNDQNPTNVSSVRLKDFLNRPIDFLKIDIEGSEYEVLKDCESQLKLIENLFIEYHSYYNEEQYLNEILGILKNNKFRYHLKESFSRRKPFVNRNLVCEKYDMAINVFAYRYE